MDLPLGVVLGTYGVERHQITWRGQAAHAGSTPMDRRRDALAGAKLALEIREIAARVGDGAVCTSGGVVCRPGIVTSVVETAEQLLDQRHLDAAKLAELLAQAKESSERFAREEDVEVAWDRIWRIDPILFDETLIGFADEAVREVSGTSHRLPSGPLHDAAEVAGPDPDGHALRPVAPRSLAHEGRGHEAGAPRAVRPGARPPGRAHDRSRRGLRTKGDALAQALAVPQREDEHGDRDEHEAADHDEHVREVEGGQEVPPRTCNGFGTPSREGQSASERPVATALPRTIPPASARPREPVASRASAQTTPTPSPMA